MKVAKLENMIRGWFVGSFDPCAFESNEVEVGVKTYRQGDYEPRHFHKVATEITCIISGRVEMNSTVYNTGDILTILPSESTDFLALTDATTVVVKIPGILNDKYLGEPHA